MNHTILRPVFTSITVTAVIGVLALGCGRSEVGRSNPAAPSALMTAASFNQTTTGGDATTIDVAKRGAASSGLDVLFPPRNEGLLFRTALEAKYRDGLRRSAGPTFVDQEGSVVWTQEYLRYRVNLCSHADSVFRVLRQIDGLGIQAACGTATTAIFPPRTEPLDFMVQLEAKYRDGLRRPAGLSFVDVEGNVVWTQEYLRYRLSTCGHTSAQQKVFDQIDGRGVQADCTPPPPTPSPTPQPSQGGFLTLTVISGQCGCVVGPIQVRANGAVVASMTCPQTVSLSIQSGASVSICDNTGCFGNTFTLTSSRSLNLVCS